MRVRGAMTHYQQAGQPVLKTLCITTFPGITQESRAEVAHLIEENKKHHILLNDHGYQNHVIHHLLDAYALGCSPERLDEIYAKHKPFQRPMPPRTLQINETNWREHLGDPNMYSDYLDFFTAEVESMGACPAIRTYFFSHELFARFFSDIHHSIIHLGFGIEFKLTRIVAESLALAALHSSQADYVLSLPPSYGPSPSLLDLFETAYKDPRFNGVVRYEDANKQESVMRNARDVVFEYLAKWNVEANKEDVERKERELFETIVLLYAASVRPGKLAKFDFFLMHSLTASAFIHVLLSKCTPEQCSLILRAHFAVTFVYYIASGRPELYINNLTQYATNLPAAPNPWLEVIKFAINTNDVHATKTLFSLFQAECWFCENNGIFLKAAQLTADAVSAHEEDVVFQSEVWSTTGVGFDQTWDGNRGTYPQS